MENLIGYYFCADCNAVNEDHFNVTEKQKPEKSCTFCGHAEWTFEPSGWVNPDNLKSADVLEFKA